MVRVSAIRRRLAAPGSFPWRLSTDLGQPLLHELLWAGFCTLMALRLLFVGQASLALSVYLAALLPYAVLILRGCALASRPSSVWWQRIRLLYPLLLMNLMYQATRLAVPALGQPTWDDRLAAADRWLLGFDLYQLLDQQLGGIYAPWPAEIFSLSYMLLFPMLLVGVLRMAFAPLRQQAAFSIGLWSIYAIGLLGYTLIPARGPYVAFAATYLHQISGWGVTHFNRWLVETGAPGYDVFPSLHIALSAFLLFWERQVAPRLFKLLLLPVALLWLSTIYLRYHYAVDLLAGALLAAAGLALALRAVRER